MSVACPYPGCDYQAGDSVQMTLHLQGVHQPVLKTRVLPQDFDHFVRLWNEYKKKCDLTGNLEVKDQLMACAELGLHQSMRTKTEKEILAEMKMLAVKADCRCSLDLGIHPFPSSSEQEVDIMTEHFKSLNDNLYKKAKEYYLCDGKPNFHLFPPIVRPDTDLGPFPPDNANQQTRKNQEWNKRCEALSAEQKVAHLFLSYFIKSEETGFFVHPFHTDTYLGGLKDKAKIERKFQAKKQKCPIKSVPLSKLEETIPACLGINIHEKIAELTIQNENENPNKKLKPEEIPFSSYQDVLSKTHCEIDNLLVVPHYLVNIEVKSVKDSSIKNVLTKAAKQLRSVNRIFVGSQKDILTDGWSFVRAMAMPNREKMNIDVDICCAYCRQFILGQTEIQSYKDGVENFMSLLPSKLPSSDSYKKLFSRLIGFYSSSEYHSVTVTMGAREARVESEKAITGLERGISSEKGPVPPQDDKKTNKNKSGKPIHLYWNPDQLQLLKNAKNLRRVLLAKDFGTGKTLLSKHFAAELAKQNEGGGNGRAVHFISLAAAKTQDIGSISSLPAVIDVASLIDMEGTGVKVIGARYLLENYNKDKGAKCVNDLLVRFMKDNEGDHFFVDELPINTSDDKFLGPDLTHLKGDASRDSYVWMVFRPDNVPSKLHSAFNKDFMQYKELMKDEDKFYLPDLAHNMRNSSRVLEAMNHIMSSGFAYNTPIFKEAVLPPNPVPGNTPVYVPTPNSTNQCAKHAPENMVLSVIESYFKEETEPITVIVDADDEDTIIKVVDNCKQNFENREVTAYITASVAEIDKLDKFLQNPHGIFITNPVLFGGMQARNVICITGGFGPHARNMLLRTTTQMVYIDTDALPEYVVESLPLKVDRIAPCCFN